ncbi:MAG: Gmad2 immunoglobulin-like domain-containing protein [Candidatus Yonathbacteria bacterium]|nr:Gmad2 immunoglobulin-like domain-containing protein [Candidatus Yonathbacteria bacterium]
MKTKSIIIIIGILVVIAGCANFFLFQCEDDWCFVFQWQKIKAVDSFERCVLLGFPVMESYPRQCRAGEKSFTEVINPVENDKIRITLPLPNTLVESPLLVQGEARGNWYFEASFPVRLLDANGRELAVIPAQAQSDWMTTEFVPFEAVLTFDTPTTQTGTLVLEKDNPSGLPEHADSVSIPLRFNITRPETSSTGVLQGTMTIGPVCPVQRIDEPCDPTPEMFAARKVFVYLTDRKTLVTTLTPDGGGKFSATLPEGDYWVDMAHQGIGGTSDLPLQIHVKEGTPVVLTIDVDTGIR